MKTIADRIKKLITLAEDKGATQGEAENAMQMAHQLLVKHNLSLTEIHNIEAESGVQEEFAGESKACEWKMKIYTHTAYLYFCTHTFSRNTFTKKTKHFFVGKPENIEVCKAMVPYFIKAVERLSESYHFSKSQYKKDFFKGCSFRLACRMRELREKECETVGTGSSLTVLYEKNDKEINIFLKNKGIEDIESKPLKIKTDNPGWVTGYIRGAEISLNQQISVKKEAALS